MLLFRAKRRFRDPVYDERVGFNAERRTAYDRECATKSPFRNPNTRNREARSAPAILRRAITVRSLSFEHQDDRFECTL